MDVDQRDIQPMDIDYQIIFFYGEELQYYQTADTVYFCYSDDETINPSDVMFMLIDPNNNLRFVSMYKFIDQFHDCISSSIIVKNKELLLADIHEKYNEFIGQPYSLDMKQTSVAYPEQTSGSSTALWSEPLVGDLYGPYVARYFNNIQGKNILLFGENHNLLSQFFQNPVHYRGNYGPRYYDTSSLTYFHTYMNSLIKKGREVGECIDFYLEDFWSWKAVDEPVGGYATTGLHTDMVREVISGDYINVLRSIYQLERVKSPNLRYHEFDLRNVLNVSGGSYAVPAFIGLMINSVTNRHPTFITSMFKFKVNDKPFLSLKDYTLVIGEFYDLFTGYGTTEHYAEYLQFLSGVQAITRGMDNQIAREKPKEPMRWRHLHVDVTGDYLTHTSGKIKKKLEQFSDADRALIRTNFIKSLLKVYQAANVNPAERTVQNALLGTQMHVLTDLYTFLRIFTPFKETSEKLVRGPMFCRGENYQQKNVIVYAGSLHTAFLQYMIECVFTTTNTAIQADSIGDYEFYYGHQNHKVTFPKQGLRPF